MRPFLFIGTFLTLIASLACKKDTAVTVYDCNSSTPTYTANVKAILDASCATSGCHNASSKKDGIDLSTYSAAKSVASQDKFRGSIQKLSGYEAMPVGGSLSADQVKLLSCWVQNGMPEK